MGHQQEGVLTGEKACKTILEVSLRNVGTLLSIQRDCWMKGWLTQKQQNLQPTGGSFSGHVEMSRSIILHCF